MKYEYLDIDGKSIAYQIVGKGKPLVLLHGWPQTSYMWRKVLEKLSLDYQLILIVLPGLGASDGIDNYDTGTVAKHLANALEIMGITKYHLVGHDIGAWVAVALAAQFEHRLRSLTVIDAGIPGLIPDAVFKPENAQRIWQFYFHAVADLPEFLLRGQERTYLEWYFQNKSVVKDAITVADLSYYAEMYSQDKAMSNSFAYYRAFSLSAEQNRAIKQLLALPVLAIGAESGVGASLGIAMQKIAKNNRSEVLANCGHYIAEERPLAFSKILLNFLAKSSSAES
ncbi:hypothetical protein LCGC14_1006670 [marine sediment metagenome]|uniref:AB hydrolase-1 domain-containing protein n=1 Tax=marine sediment metagenome TaxID=412755 RepID=A0A0F9R7L5_9ZZZZ|nr:alpha/beta hydrolase [Methylophaga aminisulfidivorans]